MRISTAAVGLLLLAGCAGNVEPLPSTFAIRDRTIWAGTRVVVESAAFVGLERAPRIRLGDEWLPVERVDDSAFAGAVPATASGTYSVDLDMDGDLESLPPVEVAGMTAARQYSTPFWSVQVLPGSGHATIFGAASLPGTSILSLTLFDLDSGTERRLAGPYYESGLLREPGASYRPGVYFGHPGPGSAGLIAFRLDAAGVTPLGDLPIDFQQRLLIEIGPGVFAQGYHHHVITPDRTFQAEEPFGAVISHAAGRATFKANNTSEQGLPVFSIPGGSLAYLLAEVTDPAAVEFSADGELIAVAEESAVLRTYRAEDGAVVRERALPGRPFAVAFDPVRPYLYVGVNGLESEFGKPTLLVLERETLADVAQLSTASSDLTCGCYQGVIVVSAEPAVYIAAAFASLFVSFRFSIPAD